MQVEPTDPITPSQCWKQTLILVVNFKSKRPTCCSSAGNLAFFQAQCRMLHEQLQHHIPLFWFTKRVQIDVTLQVRFLSAKSPQFCFNGVVVDCPTVTWRTPFQHVRIPLNTSPAPELCFVLAAVFSALSSQSRNDASESSDFVTMSLQF